MEQFRKCRSCYKHIGGEYAVDFFSYLIKTEHIKEVGSLHDCTPSRKIPLLLTDSGIEYFSFFCSTVKPYDFAFACLDGTEKKPHLAGKCGELILQYLINNKLIIKNDNERILTPEERTIKFLKGEIFYFQLH